jgi:parallel beta-helix repeat protein
LKKLAVFIVCIFVFITFDTVISSQISCDDNDLNLMDKIYVDDDNMYGPWLGSLDYPYRHIFQGIENASCYDIIYVSSGTYNETLKINKSLQIIGEDPNNTIVDGLYHGSTIDIMDDYVEIKDLTIRNSGGFSENAGLKISSSNVLIDNCIIYRTINGIYLNKSKNIEISNCMMHTNGEGVFLNHSSNITIKNCEFSHAAFGIHSKKSVDILVSNCYLYTNGIGCLMIESSNVSISKSAICDNNDNQGGFFLLRSNCVSIEDCNIFYNGVGVNFDNCSKSKIINCTLSYNTHFTILLEHGSEDISISRCEVTDNFRFGVHVSDSDLYINECNIFNNSIVGLHVKGDKCSATNNWWGNFFGPLFTEIRISDRIRKYPGRIDFFPWSFKPIYRAGSSWEVSERFTKTNRKGYNDEIIVIPGKDSDSDGVPDQWEQKWGYNKNEWNDHSNLDPDGDALSNVEECFAEKYGANPFQKDLFLEFDWMNTSNAVITNKPPTNLIEEMKQRFKERNISLHVDTGDLGGGEEIPQRDGFYFDVLKDIYWSYFLNNDLNNPRKNIFHYGLICNYGPGNGFAFIGWAHLNSFCVSGQMLADANPNYERGQLIMTGSMHETGHTLGLFADDFGGNDNRASVFPWYWEFWQYSNYRSCMNYRYTWNILDYSDGLHGAGDFDDWSNIDFQFFKNTSYGKSSTD